MKKWILFPVVAAALMFAPGCEKGTGEKVGEDLDRAADKTKEGLKDAADKTGDALEKAGDKVKDAAN